MFFDNFYDRVVGFACSGLERLEEFIHLGDVCGRGSAAAADKSNAMLCIAARVFGKIFR